MKRLKLIDVNACFGFGAYKKPDFETVTDLIQHLDYLGIERSLVWHYEARDVNPTSGNKLLLKEINELPVDLQKRVIPTFVVTPACYYEEGTLEFLKTQMGKGVTHALRVFPTVSRFQLAQMTRILLELAHFNPVCFIDCSGQNESDLAELSIVANKVPEVTFVLTQKMWEGFGAVVDLMWQCPNICTDISFIHTRGTIEMLVREFGVERVLFGMGHKSHYGAAMASIIFADLSELQREMIAYKNIESLLGLESVDFEIPGNVKDKPLWDKFRNGESLDVPIIDVHAHVGPFSLGFYLPDNDYESLINKMIVRMDQLGIDELYASGSHALYGECLKGNQLLEEKARKAEGRIFGYLSFNPLYAEEMIPMFDDFFSRKFYKGFKILASYWQLPMNDPIFNPVWEYAHKHHLPILLHTWDDQYSSPSLLTEIVSKYPNAKFMLGHSGGTNGRVEAVTLAQNNSNVYLEFCGSFTCVDDWVDTFEQVGLRQVLFGSDTCAHNQAWELGRLLSIPVPDKELLPVLAENFKRILAASDLP